MPANPNPSSPIVAIRSGADHGLIGVIRSPGLEIATLDGWNAAAVVAVGEAAELEQPWVADLQAAVTARHSAWYPLALDAADVAGTVFDKAWAEIASGLLARLRDGANVLVLDCGGAGQGGALAARLLIGLGISPAATAAEVHRAWGSVSGAAPDLASFPADRRPAEAAPDRGPEATRDRAVGALLGLAVGAALGTTRSGCRRDSHPGVVDMVGGGPFGLEPGQWTGAGAMAVALACSLSERRGFDAADFLARLNEWQQEGEYSCTGTCFDISIIVCEALDRFRESGDLHATSTEPGSADAGSLVRLAPVAIRFWQAPELLREVAQQQSRTTHAAAAAGDTCAAFAGILAEAIGQFTPPEPGESAVSWISRTLPLLDRP